MSSTWGLGELSFSNRFGRSRDSEVHVGKHELISRDDFSHAHWQARIQHGVCIDERMKLPALATWIDFCRQSHNTLRGFVEGCQQPNYFILSTLPKHMQGLRTVFAAAPR